jgi:5'(3')-deoxyribonucleotidase
LRAKKGFNTKNRPKKAMVLKIAVDIDGVLADQVTPVLKRLNARFNLSLTNKDIMEWDQKIGNTNIKVEIENALLEKEHVLSLSVIQGAIEGMKYLYDNYYETIATSRPKETEEYTKKWVSSHFKYHVFCNTRGRSKDCVQSDVLIDDHIPNIVDFVKENGFGLLFSQPWNQKRSMIDGIMREGRIFYCEDWKDVVNTVKKLNSAIDKVPT